MCVGGGYTNGAKIRRKDDKKTICTIATKECTKDEGETEKMEGGVGESYTPMIKSNQAG